MENNYENRVVLKPTEWNIESLQQMPSEEVKVYSEEMIREEAAQQAEREAKYAPEVLTQQMEQGTPFEDESAIYVPISPMLEGNGWVIEVQPKNVDNKTAAQPYTMEMTNDKFHDVLQAQYEAQQAQQAEAAKAQASTQSIVEGMEAKPMDDGTGRVMQPKGLEGDKVVYDITDAEGNVLEEGSMDVAKYNEVESSQPESVVKENFTTENAQQTEASQTIETPEVQTESAQPIESASDLQTEVQAPVIPTKADGSIDFVTYGKEGTFKILGEKYGEKMPNKVSVTAKAFADDLKKAQNKLQKAEEAYDNAPIGREQKAEEARDKAKQELEAIQREANFWAEMDAEIKDAQARRESMLNPQAEVETSNEPMSADEFVAQQLASGNIVLNKEDYKNETGFGDAEAKAMNGGAKKLFGEGGMTIQEAGERLMEMDRENGTNFFDQNDSNAGRDTLINLLSGVRSRKELNGYIASNREAQAKKDSEGLRNELEKQAIEAHYASLEDYVNQIEAEEMENPFNGLDLAQIDAIFAEAEEEYQNFINNEQGRTSEIVEGNDNVLSEEQSDDTGGTSGIESEGNSEGVGEGIADESEGSHDTTEVELKQEEGETILQFAERAAEENRRRPLRKRAMEWSKVLGVEVIFLESVDQIPNARTRKLVDAHHEKGKLVPGWFAPSNGKVYFLMSDLVDLNEVDKTYIHEVVAHKGISEMLGKERFAQLCDKVWEMMPTSERAFYTNYVGTEEFTRKDGTIDVVAQHRAAADEYIAHLAEAQNLTPEETTIWDNIVKAFRELLDKALNGIISKSKLTDKDIANIIRASYANLKNGATESAVGEGIRFDIKNKPTLNIDSVGDFISKMKSIAGIAPQIKATDETWIEKVSTPIGEIKMGENQKTKFYKNGREEFYGMAIDTLRDPNVILVEYDKEYDPRHERPFSYLFVKTFKKEDGSDYVHFESVTVAQEGLEVSISSHHLRENQLEEKLKTDRLLYKATALDESATPSAEQSINDGSRSSDNKDNASDGEIQEKSTSFRITSEEKSIIDQAKADGTYIRLLTANRQILTKSNGRKCVLRLSRSGSEIGRMTQRILRRLLMKMANHWSFIMALKKILMYSIKQRVVPTWIFKACSSLRGMTMREVTALMFVLST